MEPKTWEEQCKVKLSTLNESTAQIQTISTYLVFHRRKAALVAQIWKDYILNDKKDDPMYQLNLLYLINDVLQNSRGKGREFYDAFFEVIKETMKELSLQWKSHAQKQNIKEIVQKIMRLLNVWEERSVFNKAYIDVIRSDMNNILPENQKQLEQKKETSQSPSQLPQKRKIQETEYDYKKDFDRLLKACEKIDQLKQLPQVNYNQVVELRKAVIAVFNEQIRINTKLLQEELQNIKKD